MKIKAILSNTIKRNVIKNINFYELSPLLEILQMVADAFIERGP